MLVMQPKETQRFLKELVTGFRWPSHGVGVLSPWLLLPLCVSRWPSPALSSSCESVLWISSLLCMETLKMLSVSCHGSVWKLDPTSSCPFQVWRPLVPCFSLQGFLVASHLQNVLAKQIAGPCPRTLLPRSSKSPGAATGQGPRERTTNQKKASSGFTYLFFHGLTCPHLHIVPPTFDFHMSVPMGALCSVLPEPLGHRTTPSLFSLASGTALSPAVPFPASWFFWVPLLEPLLPAMKFFLLGELALLLPLLLPLILFFLVCPTQADTSTQHRWLAYLPLLGTMSTPLEGLFCSCVTWCNL